MKTLSRKLTADKLKTDIREQILAGALKPGSMIMSGPELAKKYHLSYQTITRAISELVGEKLLYRERGKGTFVADREQKTKKLAGLFIRTGGHIYDTMSKALINALQKEGIFPVTVDIQSEDFIDNPMKMIDELLNTEPSYFIIEGIYWLPFEYFRDLSAKGIRTVFIDRFDSNLSMPAGYVLADYTHGGMIATEHLLNLGHKKILFMTYQGVDSYSLDHRLHWQMRQGYLNALFDRFGSTTQSLIYEIENDEHADRERLKKILTGKQRPTAIFTMNDFRCKMIFSVLRELKLRVPEDVAVVGYYNTPWAEMMDVPLTSVSIKEEEIAVQAASILVGNNNVNSSIKIMIEPELVIRESCGKKLKRSVI